MGLRPSGEPLSCFDLAVHKLACGGAVVGRALACARRLCDLPFVPGVLAPIPSIIVPPARGSVGHGHGGGWC